MFAGTCFAFRFDRSGWAISANGRVLTRCPLRQEAIAVAHTVAAAERPSIVRIYNRAGRLTGVQKYLDNASSQEATGHPYSDGPPK